MTTEEKELVKDHITTGNAIIELLSSSTPKIREYIKGTVFEKPDTTIENAEASHLMNIRDTIGFLRAGLSRINHAYNICAFPDKHIVTDSISNINNDIAVTISLLKSYLK